MTSNNDGSENKKIAKILRKSLPDDLTFDLEEQKPQKTLATFTTEPKNGHRRTTIGISAKGSIVKEKCRQLSEIALNLFPDRRVPDQDLGDLIQRYIGGDRETIRAYKGYHGSIRRSKRSGEGYVIGNMRKGYLEVFDFMHRVSHGEWVIHAQMKLPNADLEHHNNEGLSQKVIEDKISLSTRVKETTTNRETEEIVVSRKYNNNNTERERNYLWKIGEPNREETYSKHTEAYPLTPEEEALLNAKYCEEPDRGKSIRERDQLKCVDCGKVDASNPYRVWCPKGMGERTRQDTCVLGLHQNAKKES